jgi:hypothetical protein
MIRPACILVFLQVRKPRQTVPVTNLNMATQLCALLDTTIEDHPRMSDPQILEALFVFCVVWSIGAAVVQRSDAPDRWGWVCRCALSIIMMVGRQHKAAIPRHRP